MRVYFVGHAPAAHRPGGAGLCTDATSTSTTTDATDESDTGHDGVFGHNVFFHRAQMISGVEAAERWTAGARLLGTYTGARVAWVARDEVAHYAVSEEAAAFLRRVWID